MTKIHTDKIDRFRPQVRNANRHTQRGLRELDKALRQDGYIAPMTAAADGEIFDGSARLEEAADIFGDEVLVVEHDGTKPIVMVRTDIPDADSEIARRASIRANRVAELDLDWDMEIVKGAVEDLDLSGLFGYDVANDPNAEWKGMPEFEQDDAFGAVKTIKVHFASVDDIESFSNLVEQVVTDKTTYIWYPKQEKEKLLGVYMVEDES